MNRLLLIIICFLAFITVKAQSFSSDCEYEPPREANIWYFVNMAGLDFNDGTVTPLTNNNVLTLGKSTAVISDENGQLLFFTDGKKVWNRNFQVMPHGGQLLGDYGCTQTAIIVQNPGKLSTYYIFTVDKDYPPGFPIQTKGLRYSIVDVNLGNGFGDVALANVPLVGLTAEKITAVRHKNGKDTWVISHGYDGDNADVFYAFLVDRDGVNTHAVESAVGTREEGPVESNNIVGYMKASPDGNRIALVIYGMDIIEIYDFDTETGKVSHPRISQSVFNYPYGLDFSPDAAKLYVSTSPPIKFPPDSSFLYQFDLSQTDPFSSYRRITSSRDSIFGSIQLGPDGKIYITQFEDVQSGSYHLCVIENPDRPGDACNYVEDGQDLAGRFATAGLPNFMQSYLDIPHFTYLHHCFKDTTSFHITNTSNITTQQWDFGDPASGNNTSTSQTPGHIFSAPGTYNVNVTETFNGQQFPGSEQVTILPLPDVNIGPDTAYLYPGASFTLDAGPGYDYYFWNFESTPSGRYFVASDTGMYYVIVVDSNCCYNIDSILILRSKIYMPNAFTPNGDGINDRFVPRGPSGAILNYQMLIFNRWGQIIFKDNDINEGWDGTVNNTPAYPGVYIYKVTYDVALDFGKYDNVVLKGYVTLLR